MNIMKDLIRNCVTLINWMINLSFLQPPQDQEISETILTSKLTLIIGLMKTGFLLINHTFRVHNEHETDIRRT